MEVATTSMCERPARLEDLDRITTIMTTAMASSASWDWRFPRRLEYPDDHWNFYRWLFGSFFQDAQGFHLRVIESQGESDENTPTKVAGEAVAFALWSMPLSEIQGKRPLHSILHTITLHTHSRICLLTRMSDSPSSK